jgi:methanogenic corrinoid protein MtbC1
MGDFSENWPGESAWKVSGADGRKDDVLAGPAAQIEDCGAAPSEAEMKRARLVRTIEGEIIPRLVLTRRLVRAQQAPHEREGEVSDGSDVTELVRLLLAHDVSVASAYVGTVRHRGVTLERVCLDLLAPAARQLGTLWEEDECDFMQVTVGLCRLHQLLRELSPEFGPPDTDGSCKSSRRILLAACPGDQHTFGISLVAQFLRRADWEVWHEFSSAAADIVDVVRQNWFAVIGLSVGSEARLDQLTAMIAAIRRESRNRQIGVLVGGPLLVANPELADMVGADATAVDGPQAVMRAEDICGGIRAVD